MAGPYTYAINIEGVGSSDASTEALGIAWADGVALSSSQKAANNYEWFGGQGSREGLILGDRLAFNDKIDPFTCDITGASQTFSLAYSDTAAQLLIYQQVESSRYVATAATAATTTIVLGDSALSSGTVVWIFDEAIKLGTNAGGGSYTGCTRGFYSTSAAPIGVGALVYTAINSHVGRRVKLLEYDHADDTITTIWSGFLDENIRTSDDGTRIELSVRSLFSLLSGAVINRGAPDLTRYASRLRFVLYKNDPDYTVLGMIAHERKPKRVAKSGDTAHIQAYQVGEDLVFGDYSDDAVGGIDATEFRQNSATSLLYSSPPSKFIKTAKPSRSPGAAAITKSNFDPPIYEVFAVIRELGSTYAATRDLTYPFHPVEIALALLTSTAGSAVSTSTTSWDCLGRAWGLGLPLDWFDTSDIAAEVAATEGQQVDRLLLGWNGEEVNVWETVKALLRAYGWFPGLTSAGLITFKRMRKADVSDVANATAVTVVPSTLKWEPARSETVDVITGTVGTLPWFDGIPVSVEARDYATDEPQNSLRAGLFAQKREVEYDFSFYADPDVLIARLINEIVLRHLAMPRFTFMTSGGSYGLGDYVSITTPDITKLPENNGWFVDATGAMTATTSGVTSFVGLVIGRRQDVRRRVWTLTVLLTNYRENNYARWIAPSWEIAASGYSAGTGAGGTDEITLVNTAFTAADDLQVTVGDIVSLWKPNGTLRSGTTTVHDAQTVAAVNTSTHVISVTPFATAGQGGDILQLAHLEDSDGYPEAGNTAGPITTDRAWAYIADASETLGSDDYDADLWDARRH